MSDVPQGPGWWQASDGKWYSPEQFPGGQPPPAASPGPPPGPFAPGGPRPPRPPGQYDPYAPTQPPGYGGYGGYGVPLAAAPTTDPMAIWALVLGIAGIPLMCLCYLGVPALIAAVPLGLVSRKRIRQEPDRYKGDGMALAGAICGIAGLLLLVGLIVLGASLGAFSSSTSY